MNRRMVIFFLGWVLRIEAMLMLLPITVSLIYREKAAITLACIAAFSFVVGFLCSFKKPKNASLYTREGFVSVALSWVLLSVRSYAFLFYRNDSIYYRCLV